MVPAHPSQPPPLPGPPPMEDPRRSHCSTIPLQLHLQARPRGCHADYIWHWHHGLIHWQDQRRPVCHEHVGTMRRGYAHFNYYLKNQSRQFWLLSLALMKRAAWFWKALLWQEVSCLAGACRQFRRARLVAMLRGHTAAANWYWDRLELMNQCRISCSVMEPIRWYYDVRMDGVLCHGPPAGGWVT